MLFFNERAFIYLKKKYMNLCIFTFINFACLYTISNKVNEQDKRIKNLTKKIEELSLKGE